MVEKKQNTAMNARLLVMLSLLSFSSFISSCFSSRSFWKPKANDSLVVTTMKIEHDEIQSTFNKYPKLQADSIVGFTKDSNQHQRKRRAKFFIKKKIETAPNILLFDNSNPNEPLIYAVTDTAVSRDSIVKLKQGKMERNNTANSGKLLENTGSSYFSSELQSNLNDQINSKYTTKLLNDSIKANSNKDFIYNSLTLNNSSGDSLKIQVLITSPKSWQLITTNIANITLEPFASSVLPIRLSSTGGNTSQWQEVRIEYRLNDQTDSRKNYFRVRVQEYSGFRASLPASALVLTRYQKSISIPVIIRNTGNTEGVYTTNVSNDFFDLNSKIQLKLPPGKDTTLMVTFNLSESRYHALKKTEVRLSVRNEKDESYSMVENISKVSDLIKDHPSAYLDMPVQVELGMMYQGEGSPAQYYAAINGNVDLDDKNKFAIALKSNTIAKGQTNKNSIMRLDYQGEKWSGAVGNIQGIGEFLVDGYGARAGYLWKGTNKAELFNMFSSRVGNNKIIGAAVQTGYKNTWRFNENFSMNIDKEKLHTAAVLGQIAEYKMTDGKIAFITGVGLDHSSQKLVNSSEHTLLGTSLGYNLSYSNRIFQINSNVLYNSNSYAGVFKGQRLHMHDVRVLYKKYFGGVYYEYNFRKQNLFQDTMLYMDVYTAKMANFGLRAGYQQRKGNITLAFGNQKQYQPLNPSENTNYNYLNLSFSYLIANKVQMTLVAFAGKMSLIDGDAAKSAFVTSNQGTLQYKRFGTSFRVDNGPFFHQEFLAYIDSQRTYRKIMFSPFAEIKMFKKRMNGRFQINYAQALPNNVTNANFIANVNYSHPTKGYDFNLNGIIPFNTNEGASAKPYFNVAFRMRLKAPFLPVRKFYNLRLVLFKDANSNGLKDKDEELIAGQTLSLNGDLFVTDNEGEVLYKNTDTGSYKADFGHNSTLRGWMPSEGNIQYFQLEGNRTILIPYKISRVLNGKLSVQKDKMSDVPFGVSNIKVMVAGDKGEVNSTLTDENGEFHFNLPAGKYIVSLSEGAFGDQFRPVEFSQPADLVNNQSVILYFEIKQKKRQINIKKK